MVCTCLDDPRDRNQEFNIGCGSYSFKKIVGKKNYWLLFAFYYSIYS